MAQDTLTGSETKKESDIGCNPHHRQTTLVGCSSSTPQTKRAEFWRKGVNTSYEPWEKFMRTMFKPAESERQHQSSSRLADVQSQLIHTLPELVNHLHGVGLGTYLFAESARCRTTGDKRHTNRADDGRPPEVVLGAALDLEPAQPLIVSVDFTATVIH
jgi:hypothetical protein